MNIDKNFLEAIIKESLEELQEEEVVKQGDPVSGIEQVNKQVEEYQRMIIELREENEKLQEENQKLQEENEKLQQQTNLQQKEKEQQPGQTAPIQESIEKDLLVIKKARLREIVLEEMKKLKDKNIIK